MSIKAPTAFLRSHYDGQLSLFLYHIESELHRRLPAAIRHYKRKSQIASGHRLPPKTITHVRKTLKTAIRVELLAKDDTMSSKMPQPVLIKQLAAATNRCKSIVDSSDLAKEKLNHQIKTYASALVDSETDFATAQQTLAAKDTRIAELERQLAEATAIASQIHTAREEVQKYKKYASEASRSRNAALNQIKAMEIDAVISKNQHAASKKKVRTIETQTSPIATPAANTVPVCKLPPPQEAVTRNEIMKAIETSSSPVFGLVEGELRPEDFPEYSVYDPDLVETESVTFDEAMMSEYGDEQFRVAKNYQTQVDTLTHKLRTQESHNSLFATRNATLIEEVRELKAQLAAKSKWF